MRQRRTQNLSCRSLGGAIAVLLALSTPAGAAFNPGSVGLPGFPGNGGVLDPGGEIVFPDPTPIPPPPPPDPTPPLQRPTLSIAERASHSLTLGWCDRSGVETGNHVWRTTNGEATLSGDIAFTGGRVIADLPPEPAGCREFVDTFSIPEAAPVAAAPLAFNPGAQQVGFGLPADTRFCYQIAPHQHSTEFGDFLSPVVCAYTREDPSRTIWRAQLQLRTAAGGSDGTDNPVNVALNRRFLGFNYEHLVGWEKPFANQTWLDRPGDDHERGSVEIYDLNLDQIGDMGDITQISIRKSGSDAWCLDGVALVVNEGVTVFERDFPSCHPSNGEYVLTVPHQELRAAASWQSYQPNLVPADAVTRLLSGQSVPIIELSRGDLESIVEGIVGHEIHGKPLYWGGLEGPRFVEVTPIDEETAGVDLDLKVDTTLSRDPKVDIDFDLRFAMACSPGGVDFAIETQDFDAVADAPPDTVALIPVLSCTLGQFVGEQCVLDIESFIEKEINQKFTHLAKSMSIELGAAAAACGCVYEPNARITAAGGLVIEARPPESPSCPPQPTPTPKPAPTPTPIPTPTEEPAVGILSTTLQLRDDASPPITPKKRRLVFRSNSTSSTPSGIVEPAFGGEGDPTTAGGAELVVYKVNGTVENVAEIPLPADHWKRIGNDAAPGYQYSDPGRVAGPIQKVRVRKGDLLVRGRGEELLELVDAPQGEVALRLRLGNGDVWCAVAPAKPPLANNDTTAKFVGQPGSPPPITCPAVPGDEDSAMQAFLVRPPDLLR